MTIRVPAILSLTGAFTLRTQSPRRFIVITTRGRYTIKRTDSWTTARKLKQREPLYVIYDRVQEQFLGSDGRAIDLVAAEREAREAARLRDEQREADYIREYPSARPPSA